MVVALGCEKLTVEMLLDEENILKENVVVLQEESGFEAMIDSLMRLNLKS